ncbi:MAG: DUF4822 domain-containing protein [Bacteroidia bacterium]|nr:DUF4822 domain-containing protein [Bacteroidia bacterium]
MTYKSLGKILGILALIAAMTGCKYPEGPVLSISSATNRISQNWEVISATDSAGNDISDNYDEAVFDFEDDKDAEATLEILGIPVDFIGTWDLDNDQTIFELDLQQTNTTIPFKREYEILRLSNSEFWLKEIGDEDILKLETD